MKPYDDTGLLRRDPKKMQNQGGGGQGMGNGLLSPFMPGDKGMIAQQLSYGFGGSPKANAQHLSQVYAPMKPFNYKFGGGGNGGQGGMPQTPGVKYIIGPDGRPIPIPDDNQSQYMPRPYGPYGGR